jgi:hypothetical protein
VADVPSGPSWTPPPTIRIKKKLISINKIEVKMDSSMSSLDEVTSFMLPLCIYYLKYY